MMSTRQEKSESSQMNLVRSSEHTEAVADVVLQWLCRTGGNRLGRAAEDGEANRMDPSDSVTYVIHRDDAECVPFGSGFEARLMNRCQYPSARIVDIITTCIKHVSVQDALDHRRQCTNQEQEWSNVCPEHQIVSYGTGKRLERWHCWISWFFSVLDRSARRRGEWMSAEEKESVGLHRIDLEQDEIVLVKSVVRQSVSETYWNISLGWNLDVHVRRCPWHCN